MLVREHLLQNEGSFWSPHLLLKKYAWKHCLFDQLIYKPIETSMIYV